MMPDRPWIGIPTGYDVEAGRYVQDRRYLDAIDRAGGVAVLIPVPAGREQVRDLAEAVDGILLPGSPTDVDPARYGEPPHKKLGRLFPERDETDFLLLEVAEGRSLPVLGICHGMQTLNVWRGGSLVQDIPSEIPGHVRHQNPGRPKNSLSHGIHIHADSLLAGIFGDALEVNSYHHQAIRETGRDLRVVAVAPDGVVEAVEDVGRLFVVGVQWHPEVGWETSPAARTLFRAFVRAASRGPKH